MSKPPFAPAAFLDPAVEVEPLPGGGMILRSPHELGPYPAHTGEMLRAAAARAPGRVFLAERVGEGWRQVTYAEARRAADSIAQALLDRGLGPERPVMVLSGNSVNHALLTLGAMQADIPVAPVSPAYSLMSRDYAKVRHIVELVRPALVYVEARAPFAGVLDSLNLDGIELATGESFGDLLAATPGPVVERAFAAIGPDSVAKYLFTSGSTGLPKGVINTQRMLCANQRQLVQCAPCYGEEPPVIVDWLPWNHTFGGNHNFNMVLNLAGTLHIDGGKPAPGLVEETVRNLAEVSPTVYFNVPAGYNALLPYLERDGALRDNFFRRLKLIFYAGAALPQDLWDRLEAVSIKARGERVVMVSSWGSTETAPLATAVHWTIERAGVIGLPVPGVELKMVPNGDKLELRVRGPNVMPGYLKRPDLTAEAFDEDGFYRIGDAGRLADPDDSAKGVLFDGRVAEDFKLTSGTWVHAGGLRVAALAACSPALQDAVVAGHDRDEVCLLAWPNLNACREICGADADQPIEAVLGHPGLVAHLRDGLAHHNAANPGSSTRVARLMLLLEPPSIDTNEITDKGYVNQRAVLERRAALVDRLYADSPGEGVIVL